MFLIKLQRVRLQCFLGTHSQLHSLQESWVTFQFQFFFIEAGAAWDAHINSAWVVSGWGVDSLVEVGGV
jgi:hypothetical protein